MITMHNCAVVLHGGVGLWKGDRTGVERDLKAAVDAAWEQLKHGRSAEHALLAALAVLEDRESFNAGYGSCLNEQGKIRCDVTLMRGNGDFCGFMNMARVRRPSHVAERDFKPGTKLLRVWTDSMMQALDQSAYAEKQRVGWVATEEEMVAPSVKLLAKQRATATQATKSPLPADTVGCLVRDSSGRLVAGTSTGGVWGKPEGRVGDAPIVGAGVFADDSCGALSATGDGEYILASAMSSHVIAALRSRQVSSSNIPPLKTVLEGEIDIAAQRFPAKSFGLICLPSKGLPTFAVDTMHALATGMRVIGDDGQLFEQIGIFERN